MRKLVLIWLGCMLVACVSQPAANNPVTERFASLTEHTFKLGPQQEADLVTLDALHWLVGSWRGEAFGSSIEETWNAPSAGSMVGLFKVMNDDDVEFYELLTIVKSDEGGLEMRVKHFSADFSAWEDKDDFIRFRLLSADDAAIHFAGLSFYRRGNNEIDGFIAMRDKAGVLQEERLSYRRYAY